MKIIETTYRPSAAQIRRKGTQSTGSTQFSDVFSAVDSGEAGSAGASEGAHAAAGTGSINPFLAMQEVGEEESRRTRAFARAQTQLQALDRLRQALLMGSLTPQTLRELEGALARQREMLQDPQLLEIMDEIELRVAVELAKIEVAQGNFA